MFAILYKERTFYFTVDGTTNRLGFIMLFFLVLLHCIGFLQCIEISTESPSVDQSRTASIGRHLTSSDVSRMINTIQTFFNISTKAVPKTKMLDFTQELTNVSEAFMLKAVEKEDQSVLNQLKDIITKSMTWQPSQSEEMNKVQVKRAINVWKTTAVYLDKIKDIEGEKEIYKVAFVLSFTANAIRPTLQNMATTVIYISEKPTVDDSLKLFEKRRCHAWPFCCCW
ncbi:uncharacterized protein LOC131948776 [Physella acuta]|uniref:uncharacterized protein LOC131948776 n=1 Tax=Physella acuta TaxID=109671 RepID=UPI0027DCE648|nr:uncharacterized protein LOC131948776 [Physella acuta]